MHREITGDRSEGDARAEDDQEDLTEVFKVEIKEIKTNEEVF